MLTDVGASEAVSSSPNPFQPAPGARPPILAGREAELASIRDATARLEHGSPPVAIAIVGLRGLGKTALLSELDSRLDPKRVTVLRLEVERDRPLAALVRTKISRARGAGESITKRLGAALDKALGHLPTISYELPDKLGSIAVTGSGQEKDESETGPLAEAIGIFNEALESQHRRLAILVDEIQDSDLPSIRSVAASVHQSAATKAPILLAVAGLPQSETLFTKIRTYTQRWDHLSLDFLTRAETANAIRIPVEHAGTAIDDAAVDRLTDECGGYPFFVQLYASAAWNEHTGARITIEDVDRAIPPVRAKIEKTFYRDILAKLTTRELAFAIALAEMGSGPQSFSELAARLKTPTQNLGSLRVNLIKKDVIISPGPRLIEFRIPLLDQYIRQHAEELRTEAVRAYRDALALKPMSRERR
jgi:AAA ATPase-like protein